MPSTPGAPRLALTRLNARLRFSGASIGSHNETSKPGIAAFPECADLPLRSAAGLNGPHRLHPATSPQEAGMAAITATGTSTTDSSAILDVRSFPARYSTPAGVGSGEAADSSPLPPPALPNRSCSFPASGSQWV